MLVCFLFCWSFVESESVEEESGTWRRLLSGSGPVELGTDR